jgi:hypothetical protein
MDLRVRPFAVAVAKAALVTIVAFGYLFVTRESLVYDTSTLWKQALMLAAVWLVIGRFRRNPAYTRIPVGRWMMAPALAALAAISVVVFLIVAGTAPDSGPTLALIAAVCFLAGLAAFLLLLPNE